MSKLCTNYNLSKETTSLSILPCSRAILLSLCFLCAFFAEGKNSQTTRSQSINSAIDVSANTDYVLTLPSGIFGSSGSLNIPAASKEHSVIIFRAVKPSAVISTWLKYIKINDTAAIDGTNCQVRMYNKGAIILPYGSSDVALTTYTGTDYAGTSCTNYSTGSNGGYMRTLTSSQLLNNFRSFKLKRGYMVTFATGTSGYGYSRCFVAAEEDLEMNLPPVLAGKVSSYRLFKWLNFGKTGVADETREEVCDLLNVQGCYTYNVGGNRLPDVEWLPHKIEPGWPGIADCGNTEYACTMKTDNEPANPNDGNPPRSFAVDQVLSYWEDAMRTGLRLCSPSTYDGSVNADWFKEFFKKIDARGWRCDIYDIHCYWASFSGLESYHNTYHRPLLISEWIWGASWNNNGCFGSGVTESQIINNTKSILTTLNNAKYVERYFYWNGESKGKIYDDNKLTSLGQAYAASDGGVGYNAAYEFVPVVVIKKPFDFSGDVSNNSVRFKWSDANGDIIDEIRIQYKSPSDAEWTTLATVEPKEKTSRVDPSYTYSGTLVNADSYCWRIANIFDGQSTPSHVIMPSVTLLDDADFLPVNLSDYYFQFYSKEAGSNLVWAVYNSGEDRVYYKAASSNYGSDLYQLWVVENNGDNTDYYLRNLGEPNYYICSPNSWNFTTRNNDYTSPAYKTTFGLSYAPDGDYWLCTNVAHGTYVGLWDNDKQFEAGEVLAGNRTNPTGTDSGDKLGIRLIPRKMVNDYLGYVTIPSGHYYLYNPASNLFINAGASWGSRSIALETGFDFMPVANNGKYLLDTNISNGGSSNYLGSDLYCDAPAFAWTFNEVGTIDGHQVYTISNGTSYLTCPTTVGSDITLGSSASSSQAKWLMLTRNDLLDNLVNATEQNPIDATFLISGPNFGRNDRRSANWTKTNWTANGGKVENFVVEYWNTNFDIHQTLANIPDGVYELSMQGYYRYGGNGPSVAVAAKQAGTEQVYAYLYANDKSQALPSIFEGAGKCGTTGSSTSFGYVPNSIEDASTYLSAGLYNVGPLRVVVTDGTLTIGVKKETLIDNDWTVLDNFQLKYLGPFLGDVNKDGIISIADAIAVVSIILGNDSTQPYLYDHVNADVNKDGYITISDAVAIVRMTLGQ